MSVRQRTYNADSQTYEQTQGQAFTVERMMPVPYKLSMSVDFWTTNYNQKLELIEQIGVLFNPALEIQSTDNFIDWTSLSVVYQDGLTFSSRSIPTGTGNSIDILTWKFHMPIWLSAPAKVRKLGVIHKIIASIFQGTALTDMQDDHLLLGTREKITPYGYKILLIGDTLQLMPEITPTSGLNLSILVCETFKISKCLNAFDFAIFPRSVSLNLVCCSSSLVKLTRSKSNAVSKNKLVQPTRDRVCN
jgi:hypothetical protein